MKLWSHSTPGYHGSGRFSWALRKVLGGSASQLPGPEPLYRRYLTSLENLTLNFYNVSTTVKTL